MDSDRIKALRRDILKESLDQFANRFARSGRTVEDWEQGRRNPDKLAVQIMLQLEAGAKKKPKKRASKKSQKNPI